MLPAEGHRLQFLNGKNILKTNKQDKTKQQQKNLQKKKKKEKAFRIFLIFIIMCRTEQEKNTSDMLSAEI